MIINASWIGKEREKDQVVTYKKVFRLEERAKSAKLQITACGVFSVLVNGKKVSTPLAPGYSCYDQRLEVQTYAVNNLTLGENVLEISVAPGWFKWYGWNSKLLEYNRKRAVVACLEITYDGGKTLSIKTDQTFTAISGKTVWSSIYDGESFNANLTDKDLGNAEILKVDIPLIKSKAVKIKEHEILSPKEIIKTPKGELVLDFGQNLTGYVRFTVNAKRGEKVVLSHGEVLDKDGNFYNANYRSAKSIVDYTCRDGVQSFNPQFSFMGFRYVRLDKHPKNVNPSLFKAVVVHSDVKRTGYINSSNQKLNQLFSNIIWGQKDNFLDIPTDCPQRDERLGWLGDAQVFSTVANYNFNCKKFYARFIDMIGVEQNSYGFAPIIVPNSRGYKRLSSVWADASTIIPSVLYDFYGDKKLLKKHFPIMKSHVDFITKTTRKKYLWIGGKHYGDWLALDGEKLVGKSDKGLISSCYYARSIELLVKAGNAIGVDVTSYQALYEKVLEKINHTYRNPQTQTECALLLHFNIAKDRKSVGEKLVSLLEENGVSLKTGFVGTPLLLHALSGIGRHDLSYKLLLKESYPSWLYSVNCGATTIWEHWDSRNEKGEFWDTSMNSFNHYALGSVADWIYSVAGGITPLNPGYKSVKLAPIPTDDLDFLECKYQTEHGLIISKWYHSSDKIHYHFETPVSAIITVNGKTVRVEKGVYEF